MTLLWKTPSPGKFVLPLRHVANRPARRLKSIVLWLLSSVAAMAQPTVIRFTNAHSLDSRFGVGSGHILSTDHYIYWQDSTGTQFIETPAAKQHSPLVLQPESKGAVCQHFLNLIDYLDFPAGRSDTLSITYLSSGLLVRNQHGAEYPDVFAGDTSADGFSAWGTYLHFTPAIRKRLTAAHPNWSTLTNTERERLKRGEKNKLHQELYLPVKKHLDIAERRNDSLQRRQQIPAILYVFNKNKILQIRRILDLDAGLIPDPIIRSWFQTHTPALPGYFDFYYAQLLNAVVEKKIIEEISPVSPGSTRPGDPRLVFDQIAVSELFPPRERNLLLTQRLADIRENFSRKDFFAYFKKFSNIVTDSALVRQVRNEYALEFDNDRLNHQALILRNSAGKKVSLSTVLARHKGKIIYVDFWASWCAPCRASFPASRELRKTLKGEAVVFLYLSIDDSPIKWEKAARQEELYTHPDSYLALNTNTSVFIRQQKLASIPRYMIFDKNGRLAYPNAPRVESPETENILRKMAAKY